MKITSILPIMRRQQKPSRYASNKGRKLKYQNGVTFLAHTVKSSHRIVSTKYKTQPYKIISKVHTIILKVRY